MKWGAIVVAAGRGTRFGEPKQFVELAGVPMVGWSLRTFSGMAEVGDLVIVTEPMWLDRMSELIATCAPRCTWRVVEGGASRQASVYKGLLASAPDCGAVFVHDGARPLVRAQDVRAGMDEVRAGRGAVLAAPVVDTIKVVDAATRRVKATLDREELWAAQTPQFAMRADLMRAHDAALAGKREATDDVALLEAIGIEVAVVPASGENFKVTHATDVARAQALLGVRA